MVLLPRTSSEVVVRCDIYAKEGYVAPSGTVEKWKWMLEKEIVSLSQPVDDVATKSARAFFSYQCGGELDLRALRALRMCRKLTVACLYHRPYD